MAASDTVFGGTKQTKAQAAEAAVAAGKATRKSAQDFADPNKAAERKAVVDAMVASFNEADKKAITDTLGITTEALATVLASPSVSGSGVDMVIKNSFKALKVDCSATPTEASCKVLTRAGVCPPAGLKGTACTDAAINSKTFALKVEYVKAARRAEARALTTFNLDQKISQKTDADIKAAAEAEFDAAAGASGAWVASSLVAMALAWFAI